MLAFEVERGDAEHMRKILINDGLLDSSRRIISREGSTFLPVVSEKIRKLDIDFKVVDTPCPAQTSPALNFEEVKRTLSQSLDIDPEMLQGGWEKIGDILVIELPKELDKKKYNIGKMLLTLFPKTNSVVNRKGILGPLRRPNVEIIAGEKTETIHRENHCKFKIDLSKVMFSAGNAGERQRMAKISDKDETVIDMFSGIGQFTIPLAKHSGPKRVVAIEKSPQTFEFLKENIRLNKLENVEPILGDCRDIPMPAADRIIMGYFFNPDRFLSTAIEKIRPEGTIHFHDIVEKEDIKKRTVELKEDIKALGKSSTITNRVVKSYAPKRWHVVFDLCIK
ncbi:MAG: class I SAM-dependent methyltransferase family protein [Candidatus Hydrothermarchaeaceae archaeon]